MKQFLSHKTIFILFILLVLFGTVVLTKNLSLKTLYRKPPLSTLPTTTPLKDTPKANEIDLTNSSPEELVSTGITLELLSFTQPIKGCNDCLLETKIKAIQKDQTVLLNYKIGGIAGFMQNTQNAFGYTFVLLDISSNGVRLQFAKQQ